MLGRLLLLFILVPTVEVILLVWIADRTSFWTTFGLIVLTGVVGASLARAQGWRVMTRMREQLAAGQLPADSLLDALMIFVAGALLVTPGILTDLFGFSLLMPFCRRWYRVRLTGWFRRHMQVQFVVPPDSRSEVVDSYVVDEHGNRLDHQPVSPAGRRDDD